MFPGTHLYGLLSADAFIPSVWNGNYTCARDNFMVKFLMNITKSSQDQIDLDGDMYIDNSIIRTGGSFATAYRILTLQTDDVIYREILGKNFTKVELNGRLQSPVFIDGVIIFNDDNGHFQCPMELRRGPSKSSFILSYL